MTCDGFVESLDRFLAEDLEPAQAADAAAHAASCPTCAARLATMRNALAGLGQLPDVEAPASLLPKTMERVRRLAAAREAAPRRSWWLGWVLVGAAAVAVVAVAPRLAQGPPPGPTVALAPVPAATPASTPAEAPGEARTLTLAGLGEVRLAAEAELRLLPDGATLSRGQGTFDLDLRGRRWALTTPAGVVEVTGTLFDVDVAGDGVTTVTVARGAVTFAAEGVRVPVPAGRRLTVRPGQAPGPAEEAPVLYPSAPRPTAGAPAAEPTSTEGEDGRPVGDYDDRGRLDDLFRHGR